MFCFCSQIEVFLFDYVYFMEINILHFHGYRIIHSIVVYLKKKFLEWNCSVKEDVWF